MFVRALVRGLEVKNDDRERGQDQEQRLEVSVAGHGLGLHSPRVAHAASSVDEGVAVQDLPPMTGAGDPDPTFSS